MPVTPPCVSVVKHAPPPPSDEIMAAFPSVFDGQVKSMEGEEFHIELVDGAQPFCVHTPRTIPFAYREKLQDELALLQSHGIIAPVTTPTEWCQCPLDEASQLLTTFITPFGRFKFLRAPYGISSISEHYNRRMDEALKDTAGLSTMWLSLTGIQLCTPLTLKCFYNVAWRGRLPWTLVYARPEVDFAGFHLSGDGYSIDNSIVTAYRGSLNLLIVLTFAHLLAW